MTSVPLHHDTQTRSSESRRQWTVRPFEPGDEQGVNGLFNRVFGKSRSIEEWKWKFERNPGRLPKVIAVATTHERIVGMYPCVVGLWKIAQEIRTVVQPVETAIDEHMRGGPMIMALHEAHVAHCQSLGVGFSYGTPTEGHAKFGKRRLGYTEFTTLPLLRLDLNARVPVFGFLRGPLKSMYLRIRTGRFEVSSRSSPGELRVKMMATPNEFDGRFDRLWQQVSKSHDVMAVRDAGFLRWRYFERPGERERICLTISRDGLLVGYLMLVIIRKHSDRVAIVMDFLALPTPSFGDRLVQYALAFCADAQVDYLVAGALPHMELFGALRRAGFGIRKTKPICMTFKSVDQRLFDDPTRWYVTLGDFDYDEE